MDGDADPGRDGIAAMDGDADPGRDGIGLEPIEGMIRADAREPREGAIPLAQDDAVDARRLVDPADLVGLVVPGPVTLRVAFLVVEVLQRDDTVTGEFEAIRHRHREPGLLGLLTGHRSVLSIDIG